MSDNPVAIVTGGSRGVGAATAKMLSKNGWNVIITCSSSIEEAEKVAKECSNETAQVIALQADVSNDLDCKATINKAIEKWNRIDALINNAGTFQDTDFESINEENFNKTFNLNVRGYMFTSQEFVKQISTNQNNTSIICIGSSNSLAAEKNSVMYDTSKGAVLMMIKSMAISLASKNIRVNGIGPGILETPLTSEGLNKGNNKKVITSQIPLGRIGEPSDIGGAAVFLASDEAKYITGQMLYVDGGILANQLNWDESLL